MKWILLLFPCIAFASGSHDVANTTFNTTISHNSTYKVVNEASCDAMGLAASEKHMYYGTLKLQGAVGLGACDGSEAASIGIAQRFGSGLFSISVTKDNEDTGYSAGFLFHF